MPKLTLSSVKKSEVLEISKDLIDNLAAIASVPRNAITLEFNETENTVIFDGEVVPSHPTVNVYWFERPQDIQDALAEYINKKLFEIGYDHVTVIFTGIPKTHWYSNGKHF